MDRRCLLATRTAGTRRGSSGSLWARLKVVEDKVPALTCLDEAVVTFMTLKVKEYQTKLSKSTCFATLGAVVFGE